MIGRSAQTVRPPTGARIGQAMIVAAVVLLVGCVYRLIWIERHLAPGLRAKAEDQQYTKQVYVARRGSIVDTNPLHPDQHNILAASYLVDSAFIDPELVEDPRLVVSQLGRMFDIGATAQTALEAEILDRRQKLAAALAARKRRQNDPARRDGPPGPDEDTTGLRFIWVPGGRMIAPARADAVRKLRSTASVYVNPAKVGDAAAVVEGLGGLLDLDLPARNLLAAEIARRRTLPKNDPAREFLLVASLVSDEQELAVRELFKARRYRGIGFVFEMRGVDLQHELKREYPADALAGPVLGFVGKGGEGLDGLEKQFDPTLAGKNGSKRTITDRSRRPIWSTEADYASPHHGRTLVLNLSAVVQALTEKVLVATVRQYEAESGVAVVMDPRNGAVLAMANVPGYSPGDYQHAPEGARNRCLTDPFEPGSIFKWVVLAGAIDSGVVRPDDTFDCHGGSWTFHGRTIRDSHGYGVLSARMVLVKSSNIGMSQIGLRMKAELVHRWLTEFGFGQKSGIELAAAESPGLLHPLARWTSYSVPSLSFGQEIAVTAIQMVRAFSALANGGYLLTPRLVRAVEDEANSHPLPREDYTEPAGRRILSAATARTMVGILTDVVDVGTGQKARIPGVKVFGKTGTAQVAGDNGLYHSGWWTSSFIGGAPSEAPRLVVLVSIRKPNPDIGYYGGTVAAPAVRQILEQALAFTQPQERAGPVGGAAGYATR